MRNNLVKLFFKCLTILLITGLANAINYAPVLELNLKGGNKRHIGRIGGLLPLYSEADFIGYTTFFAMKDSKTSLEGNLGLGSRKIFNDSFIVGLYGFGDIRRSRDGKRPMYQVNAGLELFSEHLEFRVNGYVPITDRIPLSDVTSVLDVNYSHAKNVTTERRYNSQTNEVVLQGYDIDLGGNTSFLPELSTYVAFFHFFKDNLSQRGVRLRSDYALRDWASIGFEINYDNKRKWYNYLDVKLQYHFDSKKNNRNSLTALQKKMTLLPVRDIDEVTLAVDDIDEIASAEQRGKAVYFVEGTELDIKGIDRIPKNSIVIFLGSTSATQEVMRALKEYSNIVVLRKNGTSYPLIQNGKVHELTNKNLSKMMNQFKVYIPAKDAENGVMRKAAKDLNGKLAPDVLIRVRRMEVDSKVLVDNGVNVKQLKRAKVSYYEMIKEKVTVDTIKDHTGATLKDLIEDGVNVSTLKALGYSYEDMVNDKVTIKDLYVRNVSFADMQNDNIPLKDIVLSAKSGDLAYMSLMNNGISAQEIVNCDISDYDDIDGKYITYADMKNEQFVSAAYLRNTQHVNSKDLIESGLSPSILYSDGISAYQMKDDGVPLARITNGAKMGNRFTGTVTHDGIDLPYVLEPNTVNPGNVVTTKHIRDSKVFYTNTMLNKGFNVAQIHGGGVTYYEMDNDGVPLQHLKDEGVSANQLYQSGIDLPKIMRVYTRDEAVNHPVDPLDPQELEKISRMDYLMSNATRVLPKHLANPLNHGFRKARTFIGKGYDLERNGYSLRAGVTKLRNSGLGQATHKSVDYVANSRLGQYIGLNHGVNWLWRLNAPYSQGTLV